MLIQLFPSLKQAASSSPRLFASRTLKRSAPLPKALPFCSRRHYASAKANNAKSDVPWIIVGLSILASGTYYAIERTTHATVESHEKKEIPHAKKAKVKVNEEVAAVTKSLTEPKSGAVPPSPVASADERVEETEAAHFEYVLVGGGTASYHAMLAIREKNPNANVLIISEEATPPYQRPPLTKDLWFTDDEKAKDLKFTDWQGKEASLLYEPADWYTILDASDPSSITSDTKVKLICGHRVVSLNADEQVVRLDNGKKFGYGKVLLGCGGVPKKLPALDQLPAEVKKHVTTYRTVEDFKHIHSIAKGGKHIAIIGGGFLGSELACALASKGKSHDVKVSQIYREEGNCDLVFPKYLAKWTTSRLEDLGVIMHPSSTLRSIKKSPGGSSKVMIELSNGTKIEADHVVVSIGIDGNTNVAKTAGLEVDCKGGVVTNAELEARSNVFVAGDLVSYYDDKLGIRRRIEHYDHAVTSGKIAGQNMVAGTKPEPYRYQPMFWSDLGPSISYEAVGIIDSALPTVSIWEKGANNEQIQPGKEEYNKGVILYTRDDKIVGALMFNVHGRVDVARKIIGSSYRADQLQELTKEFKLLNN